MPETGLGKLNIFDLYEAFQVSSEWCGVGMKMIPVLYSYITISIQLASAATLQNVLIKDSNCEFYDYLNTIERLDF